MITTNPGQSAWGSGETQHFYTLTPDHVLDAVEELDIEATGRVLQMNSMENRVYEVEIELDYTPDNPSDRFKIIKFYRPGRWSKEQIQDEHDFLWDLKGHEIQVIAPLKFNDQTIFKNKEGLWYSLFPKKGGRAADEWSTPLLEQMGRLLARLHNIGESKISKHRINLDIDTYGYKNLEYLLSSNTIPKEYSSNYETIVNDICKISAPIFKGIKTQRVHGDCHHGNTLLGSDGPYLIDFDDMVNAPRVQDIWMVTPGRDQYSIDQRNILLDAYESMSEFDYRELKLIETLRALRMVHFSSWIAHRFEDDSFKRAFPTFNTGQYWEREIFHLREQLGLIQDDINSLQGGIGNY
jgi:Ser/Thr protein kinase RdoA (MazF antagonist)